METLNQRTNGRIGVGGPGKITPDGIEAKLINMSRNRPPLSAAQLAKEGNDIAKSAYVMAAIAEVAKNKCPVKKVTKKGDTTQDPKDWAKWTEEMSKYSRELAKAAQAKELDKVKDASAKLYSSCLSCHASFRDF
jgi:cytochrome c556